MTPTQAGTVLGGRYELDSKIAAGGMGEVWRATDRILQRSVAIKLVHSALAQDVQFRQRFRNEARLAAQLTHAHVAQVHDFGEDDETAYLVMELVAGSSVAALMGRGPVALDQVTSVVRQAAAGLGAAHDLGMVHRDVKPANLLLTPRSEVKVTDFGIARALGEAKVTRTGEVLGTAQYLAPEAALGREAGPQSDVYALAVVTYELLAGYRPFEADSAISLALKHVHDAPPPLPGHVPYAVAQVVMRGLGKDPQWRQTGVLAFASELDHAARSVEPTSTWTTPPASAGQGPPPISWPQAVSSVPPPVLAYQPTPSQGYGDAGGWPGQPIAYGMAAPVAPARVQGSAARGIAWVWVAASVLTALACLLPFAASGDQSWNMFQLAQPIALNGADYDAADNSLGFALAIPMLLVGLLGLPAALRRPRIAWPLIAIPGCLWSALCYLATWATIWPDGNAGVVSASMGMWVVPLVGTVSFAAAVIAIFKRF